MFFATRKELAALTSRFDAMVRDLDRIEQKLGEVQRDIGELRSRMSKRDREYDHFNQELRRLKYQRNGWQRLLRWIRERREIDTDPTQSIRVPKAKAE